ncbi:hypothetical protein GXB81_22770 [Paraburkholderia sp. Ac-20336]|uniref:hypothetical protein n=1 Tax=Paraburkholderia sp. Ac-20336 TaxID=2703886 RepID=UPI00197E8B36|nr:hypothetical protein [Paraburkholderia sp. Ac-20336]MBN3805851.1 hypothetical protein [Paraburkholderia sp. Ac-20336]
MSDITVSNPAENRIGAIETGKRIWAHAVAAADWVGGALKGEFGQQQTIGQIIFDATLSMFPLLGEGTAARDSIAIILRMSDSRQSLEDKWEWIRLTLCMIAVVPILGGVLKGVGKLLVRTADKSEDLAKLAEEIVLFVNRMCYGNAYAWLRTLNFMQYQGKILDGLAEALNRFSRGSQYIVHNMGDVLPPHVVAYLSGLPEKFQPIRSAAGRRVPQALRDLNEALVRVRAHLVEGTFADISVGSGKITTHEAEGQLSTLARDAGRAVHPAAGLGDYRHVDGWPDLTGDEHIRIDKTTNGITYEVIASFSKLKPIEAITLKPGQYALARVLDNTKRTTKSGYKLKGEVTSKTKRSKNWLPRMARNGHEWREKWAVKMDWNHNGAYITLDHIPTLEELRRAGIPNIPDDWTGLRIWRGEVSSQFDEDLGRWLEGGETQFIIDFDDPYNKVLEEYVMRLTEKPTNWTDVNFAPVDRAAVRPLDKDQILPKTVPHGYTNRAPAVAGHALPYIDTAQSQY